MAGGRGQAGAADPESADSILDPGGTEIDAPRPAPSGSRHRRLCKVLPLNYHHCQRGRSSVVEHNVANVGVVGSNPIARSRTFAAAVRDPYGGFRYHLLAASCMSPEPRAHTGMGLHYCAIGEAVHRRIKT